MACNIPRNISKQSDETIQEDYKANNSSWEQHVRVISKPREIDRNLIAVVLSANNQSTTGKVYTQTLSDGALRERVQFNEFLKEFSELEQ